MTREEAIKGLTSLVEVRRKYFDMQTMKDEIECLCMAIKALEQQPSWVSVSERLPEKQDCYLVTTKWKGSCSNDVYIETNMDVYREKPKEWNCKDVIAWMPLPEPYEPQEGGE